MIRSTGYRLLVPFRSRQCSSTLSSSSSFLTSALSVTTHDSLRLRHHQYQTSTSTNSLPRLRHQKYQISMDTNLISTISRNNQLPKSNNKNKNFFSISNFSTSTINSPVDAELTHQYLRSDVKLLGQKLGNSIQEHTGENIFKKVEHARHLARAWREGDAAAFQTLNDEIASYSIDELKWVSSAFAHFLTLANTAETHNKVRAIREQIAKTPPNKIVDESTGETKIFPNSLPQREDSCLGSIKSLLNQGVSKDAIWEALSNQYIELILTAHPTEVNRRTLLNKYKKIAHELEKLHFGAPTDYEKYEIDRAIAREVSSIWNSDLIRRSKPTPLEEAKGGMAIVEQILWDAVPSYLRKLDITMKQELGKGLPLTAKPIRFGSWMGGDRDGNPNVTPQTTRRVHLWAKWFALTLLKKDVRELKMILSSTKCSQELRDLVGPTVREPYREVTRQIEEDIVATLDILENLTEKDGLGLDDDIPTFPIESTKKLLEKFLLLHKSLIETDQILLADGLLSDTIRRLSVFGISFLPLDIRQESTNHSEAIDAITRHLGLGSYLQWDEKTRMNWLLNELSSKRPLMSHPKVNRAEYYREKGFSDGVIDVLETFQMLPQIDPEGLGAYVISMAKQPSDVLLVQLLMKEYDLEHKMRVVPLFETLADLTNSYETMNKLFSLPYYRGEINSKQEVMIGYSDSAKDAGRIAAVWAQYKAQANLAKLAETYDIELTFFHGKGGTVSRGGNPSMYRALVSQPPGTLNGRFRVTEQGEMITQNFGHKTIAEHTFDIYSSGVLMEKFQEPILPSKEWSDKMEELSDLGCKHYRATVREDERFIPYFRSATPEAELGSVNVGSRPQKRRPGGVETLRAIPWVFAWTQTRLQLSAWLGVGEAIEEGCGDEKSHQIVEDMYEKWPFFKSNIDLVDMILSKADVQIAGNYDSILLDETDSDSIELGKELRERLIKTTNEVLKLSGHTKLLENEEVLAGAVTTRNTYVDPLNVLQANVLSRLRNGKFEGEEEEAKLKDALVTTINGISAGMKNTG